MWSRPFVPLALTLALVGPLVVSACTDSTPARPVAAPAAASEPVGVAVAGWSSIHADGANSDFSPVEGAIDLEPAWQVSFDGNVDVGATVHPDGLVLVTTTAPGSHLCALEATTGETRWCSDEVDRYAAVSSALLDADGRAFVGDGAAMHAFDVADGTLLWEVPHVGVPLSAQLTPAGHVLVLTHLGQLSVLDRETGEALLPTVELVPGASFDPAAGISACARGLAGCPSANTVGIDDETGRFFFTFWEPGAPQAGVRAMRLVEGDEGDGVRVESLWTNDALPGGSASSPTLSADGSRVYVNDGVDSAHALDAETGATIWSVPIGYASGGSPSISPDGLLMPAGGAVSPLVAVADLGTEGEVAWRQDELQNRGIATQAAGEVAYVTVSTGPAQNDLVVVDTDDGRELDREPLPGTTGFSVGTTVGLDGAVYVPTIRGQLFAFRPA